MNKHKQLIQVGFIVSFALLGVVFLLRTQAAVVFMPFEAEDSDVTGSAAISNDATASNNQLVTLNISTAAVLPATILDLSNWKITLPTDTEEAAKPDEILQPELATFSVDPYFKVNDAKDGVVFRAHAGGVTTSGSSYPRSELREMTNNGTQNAGWGSGVGVHKMTIRQAITHVPVAKPHVVAGQIHNENDDQIMVRLEGMRLFLETNGDEVALLDANYVLGTPFTVTLLVLNNTIRVTYNDALKHETSFFGDGLYFKAGCYTQSNLEKGDTADAYGEVVIYDLTVEHSEI